MDRKKRNRRRVLRAKCEVVDPFHWVLSNWRSSRPDGRASGFASLPSFSDLHAQTARAVAALTPREREILRTRFGVE